MNSQEPICVGEMQIQPKAHSIVVHGKEVGLTPREFDIVAMLAEHPGWTYSIDQLSEDDRDGDYSPQSVSVLVSRLRQKLTASGAPDIVETVRGVGYRLHMSAVDCDGSVLAPTVNRELRDALWQLQEAVIEIEHLGNAEQQGLVTTLLERARLAVYGSLAELPADELEASADIPLGERPGES